MKKAFILFTLAVISAMAASATVLFPHFVDIAPNYNDGSTQELIDAGVTGTMYYGASPGSFPSTFAQVESFYKDTMPSEVVRQETKVGDARLVSYTSLHRNNDLMATDDLLCVIYVLELSDGTFVAGYSEKEVPREN